MEAGSRLRKLAVVAGAVVLLMSQGCAVGRYFQCRGEDFAEIMDIGVTVTKTPQIGLYWNSLDLLVLGYSDVDGYFAGWGGGQFGVTRHYNNCYGAIVGHEKVGWGKFNKDDPKTLYMRYSGLLGLASLAGTGDNKTTPDYTPACVHFFPHIGYVGLVWNARWTEMLDFIVGFTTIDLAGDDGHRFGKWPGQRRVRE
ncbi:MAG: hypothetical protein J7M08_06220 [Planctomycetes bacterium]|nr:hypothetical protein [Planctomycetota bacterium]